MMGSGESPGSILRQIGRTALLAGSLGLVLYGVLALLAEWPHAHLLLGLALSLPLALLCAWEVADGWMTGDFPVWRSVVRRAEQPGSYWFHMSWCGLCGLALLAIAATSGWRLALAVALDAAGG